MELTAGFKMLAPLLIVFAVLTGTALAQNCKSNYVNRHTASLNTKTIRSPNYPLSEYDHNTVCLWMIERSFLLHAGYVLKVVFNDFELEDTVDTNGFCYDSLKFYDGPSIASRLLGSYCGTVHPDVIYSTGEYLFVRFRSDEASRARGFSFSYSAVKKEETTGICRSAFLHTDVSRLSGSSGTFFSPNYPVPYHSNRTCIWTITVPAGKRIKLTFENFTISVAMNEYYCSDDWKDYVEIRDGLTSNGKELARYSCSLRNTPDVPDVYSSGRYMWVNFHSSPRESGYQRSGKNKGFKAHFEAVDPSDVNSNELCLPGNKYNGFLRLTGNKGTVKSPLNYPPNLNCTWLISVPKDHHVKLALNRWDLDRSRDCGDYIEIFFGLYFFSERQEKFCGYDGPALVMISWNQFITVNFRSDNVYRPYFRGFEFTFTAEPDNSTSPDPKDDGPATRWVAGVIGGIAAVTFLIFLMVCIAKKRQASQRETDEASVPMTTNTTSASHGTEPCPPPPQAQQDNSSPAPTVGYAPASKNPPPEYPYPPNSPPPYPGVEGTPQYPPPGQSYPWLSNNSSAQASAPPAGP